MQDKDKDDGYSKQDDHNPYPMEWMIMSAGQGYPIWCGMDGTAGTTGGDRQTTKWIVHVIFEGSIPSASTR